MNIAGLLQTGINYHTGGNLQEAEKIYLQILKEYPDHPDATHFMGVLAYNVGKNDIAKVYIEKGLGREITKEEALEILEKAQEDGLVLQPGNSQRPMNICTCCGCCCGVLSHQNKLEEPAQFFASNFYAEVDPDECIGCGICEDRCNMDAVHVEDATAVVNLARCIGCGACVPTCTSEAIKLYKKDEETIPPKNTVETYLAIMDKKAELARAEK